MNALTPYTTGPGFTAIVSLFIRSDVPRTLLEELLVMARDRRDRRRVIARETQLDWVKDRLRTDPYGRVRSALED
jgi:hypothetical protein